MLNLKCFNVEFILAILKTNYASYKVLNALVHNKKAICNCDRDCLAYKFQISSDLTELMFKSEYTAHINKDLCVGCRSCMSFCQFGAIEYSTTDVKCYINPEKCYGCGVCRNACKKQAINLTDKQTSTHINLRM